MKEKLHVELFGGTDKVFQLIDYLYNHLMQDSVIKSYFIGVDMERLKAHQIEFFSMIIAGIPHEGTKFSNIRDLHIHLNITDEVFDRFYMAFLETIYHFQVAFQISDEVKYLLLRKVLLFRKDIVASPTKS